MSKLRNANLAAKGFSYSSDPLTRALLLCGVIAGPLFTIGWIVVGTTRSTYDPLRYPISSLAIGEYGWTQTANFIVTGILTFALAFGLWRVLKFPGGSTSGSLLIGMIAVGFLGAGFFVTDPMNGYPPGTPALPVQYTLTGRLHRLFSALVFLGLPTACFVFARLFNRQGERRWRTYSVITGILFIILFVVTSAGFAQVPWFVDYAGLFQRITLITGLAWLTLLPARLLIKPIVKSLLDLRGSVEVIGEQDFDAIRNDAISNRSRRENDES